MSSLPAFFEHSGDGYVPTGFGGSVWNPEAVGGVAVGGLLAHLIGEAAGPAEMNVARLTVDILGVVPRKRITGRVIPVRQGARLQILAAELMADDRVVARATALRVRAADTPVISTPNPYPAPETAPLKAVMPPEFLPNGIRNRPVSGGVGQIGPGVLWSAFDFEVIKGVPLSPLERATIVADFGNGVGSALSDEEWSFANVDVHINFHRMPRGEWVLIDATTLSAGNGYSTVRNIFADREGIYAIGAQTLFVAPVPPR